MDQILLCTNHLPPITTIYNSFIQNEMLDANGSYVKVYLYLNMCIQSGNTAFSISSLADQMDNTEKDIIRALNYWEKRELIILKRDEKENTITGIEFLVPGQSLSKMKSSQNDLQAGPAPKAVQKKFSQKEEVGESTVKKESLQKEETKVQSLKETDPKTSRIHVTEEQLLRLGENSDFKWITTIVQNFLKRPVSSLETELLIYLYDDLNFSRDLILYLYEYCCTLGKTHIKYVQAVALSWAEQKITTPEQAKTANVAYNATHTAIAKAFGLNRTLGAVEMKYIECWSNEWNFELSAILEACNRTLLRTQKADFKYADSILSNWKKNGIHTLEDIKIADENFAKQKAFTHNQNKNHAPVPNTAPKNQFQSFQQRNISAEDVNMLEQKLLARQ